MFPHFVFNNWLLYLVVLIAAISWSIFFTILVKYLAEYFGIVDKPDSTRKIHRFSVPLLGGLAIFLSCFLVLFLVRSELLVGKLEWNHWLGVFVGALILMIGGFLDDKYNLPPKKQIIFPILAILAVIIGGVEIEKINSFAGGFFYFKDYFLLGYSLIFLWLLGMMYTTKLLDGLDGLVTGVVSIGALMVFLFTLTTHYYQPDIAIAALTLFGSALGFLFFNFNPAKIFLGEGGALFLGYMLGVLAIISGGKIAVALLVMGVPILDVVWTISRRLLQGKNPFRFSDKKHLHHRLLALGFSQKATALIFYAIALFFGASALFLQSRGKFLALFILLLVMLALVIFFSSLRKKTEKPSLLLHICCAPCGIYPVSILKDKYNITLYFLNPNISTSEEFALRLRYVKVLAEKYNLPLIVEDYDHKYWLDEIRGLENEPEKGKRCRLCYSLRLAKTAQLASENKFLNFATTLSISPYKDQEAINTISLKLAREYQINYLSEDWRQDNAYQESIKLAKEMGFYRQKFCGCEFSQKPK
ncbi:MAG: epoxyqueuosine reductase QueH [Planctomycetes bacterium]|jgi:UDP-GlcNAc:undecaprenyl-phosphate GlcNAc-1-phosphate transferase|nr:epoxyqueuosine reductase QueH [Planctomycetota bacterium]